MADVNALNRKYGIAGLVEIVEGHGGLAVVRVKGKHSGEVYLHGVHVAAWRPAGNEEVLWLSAKSMWEAGKPIRGGVPICFPWFGPRKGDTAAPPSPAHGFARLREWELEGVTQAGDAITVALGLKSDAETKKIWGQDFVLRHRVTIGEQLVMSLELTNSGGAALTAEEALHTHFAVADVKGVKVTGLEGVKYVDKVDGMKIKTQEGAITITGETDRVYLDTTSTTTIEDVARGRKITVAKEHSKATVVWNPWVAKAKAMADFGDEEWPGMICVETCSVADYALQVGPGQTHVMTARISVAKL